MFPKLSYFPVKYTKLSCLILFVIQFTAQCSAIDFSQFYLPPCCYIAGEAVASAPSEQNGTYVQGSPRPRTRSTSFGDEAETEDVFKLVVPLKFPSVKGASASLEPTPIPVNDSIEDVLHTEAAPAETTKRVTTTTSSLLTLNDDVKDTSSSDIFNVVLLKELEKMNLNQLLSTQPTPLTTTIPPSPQVSIAQPKGASVFDKIANLGFSMSERLQKLSNRFESMSAPTLSPNQNSHGPYQIYRSLVKRQVSSPINEQMKMPAIWIKNLRKALYQSLSSRQLDTKSTSSDYENYPSSTDFEKKQLWKQVKKAQLKFIDLRTNTKSDLPEEIYLPAGKGPIVSGVATVGAQSGALEIRIPSELHTPSKDNQASGSGETVSDLCECSLVNEGDMVLAYWSISRIVADDGQPALQYLVYPIPHPYRSLNPPTPPELLPFNDKNPHEFNPSPVDPLPNYLNEIPKTPNGQHHKLPIITEPRHRTPKLYDEQQKHLPVGPPHLLAARPNLPPSPALVPGPSLPEHPSRGVLIDHNDSMKSVAPFGHEENYIPNHIPQGVPPPPAPTGLDYQVPYEYAAGEPAPPTSIPGIATPVGPTSIHGPLYHDDEHPKSIQDILLPPPPPQPNTQVPAPPSQQYYNNQHQQKGHLNYNDRRYNEPNIYPYVPQKPPPPYRNDKTPYYIEEKYNTKIHYGKPYPQYNYISDEKRLHYTNNRDFPRKQAYVKEYFNKPGRTNFAQRFGAESNRLGSSLNDIDNPDGYILDFK